MDSVFIEKLTAYTVIGAYQWEQQFRQKLEFDVEMGWDTRKAAASDELEDALDYAAVSRHIIEYVSQRQFALLERVAEEVAQQIMTTFAVRWLRLRVSKPGAVPEAARVGVLIERTTNAGAPSAHR